MQSAVTGWAPRATGAPFCYYSTLLQRTTTLHIHPGRKLSQNHSVQFTRKTLRLLLFLLHLLCCCRAGTTWLLCLLLLLVFCPACLACWHP